MYKGTLGGGKINWRSREVCIYTYIAGGGEGEKGRGLEVRAMNEGGKKKRKKRKVLAEVGELLFKNGHPHS